MAQIIDLAEIRAARQARLRSSRERLELEQALAILRDNLSQAEYRAASAIGLERAHWMHRIEHLSALCRYGEALLERAPQESAPHDPDFIT